MMFGRLIENREPTAEKLILAKFFPDSRRLERLLSVNIPNIRL